MKNSIKLLVFAKTIDGGTGTFLKNFLDINKIKSTNPITIKVIVVEKPKYIMTLQEANFSFLKKRDYSLLKYSFSIKNISTFVQEFKWFKKQVEIFCPDIILSIDINCNIMTVLLKKLFFKKVKTITTIQVDTETTLQYRSTPFLKSILKKILKLLYSYSDIVVCPSYGVSRKLEKYLKIEKKIETVYNGMNFTRTIKKDVKNNHTIITVARLDPSKDHKTLLKAFSIVRKTYNKARLWILSDGPLRKELELLSKELGINKQVKFFGVVRDIFPYLDRSDIFVLSSNREGFSYALVEAMSQKKPVISTDTPSGPAEVLGNGKYGIVVPLRDEKTMAQAIIRLFSDKNLFRYYSLKAFERSKYFNREKMLRKYRKIIGKLYDE